jgi:hypothetical protein
MHPDDWEIVRSKFVANKVGMVNMRLEECREVCKSRSDKAKRAADRKWADARSMRTQCSGDANASLEQCKSESESESDIKPPIAPPSKGGQRGRRTKRADLMDPNWSPF